MPWVSISELAEQTGFVVRSLQYIRQQEPGVLVYREKAGRTEYKQPDCASNLFKRERRLARKELNDAELDEAKERALKIRTERKIKDLELARAEREQALIADIVRVVGGDYEQVRARMMALIGKLPPRCVGLKTIADAAAVIEPEVIAALESVSRVRFTDVPEAAA